MPFNFSPKNKTLLRPTVIEVGQDGFITVPYAGTFESSRGVEDTVGDN